MWQKDNKNIVAEFVHRERSFRREGGLYKSVPAGRASRPLKRCMTPSENSVTRMTSNAATAVRPKRGLAKRIRADSGFWPMAVVFSEESRRPESSANATRPREFL
jgi:hypothetical protein